MRGEGGTSRTSLVGAWFDGWTAEPAVGEFVIGWWFTGGFGMVGGGGGGVGIVVMIGVVGVEFFAVHVGMGADAASLHRTIHPERKVP